MSHITPLSGTGQFIEPVMSTMKYRSTCTAWPSAEVDVQAVFGSTEPPPPPGLPVLDPTPGSMLVPLPLPAWLLVLILPLAPVPPATFDSSTFEPQASAMKVPNKIGATCPKRIRETSEVWGQARTP